MPLSYNSCFLVGVRWLIGSYSPRKSWHFTHSPSVFDAKMFVVLLPFVAISAEQNLQVEVTCSTSFAANPNHFKTTDDTTQND